MILQLIGAISSNDKAEQEFADAEAKLTAAGYEVINPFKLCAGIDKSLPKNQYWWECMKLCGDSLISGDKAAVIINDPGNSNGAIIEIILGRQFGIPRCNPFDYLSSFFCNDMDEQEASRIRRAIRGLKV